MGLTNGSGWEWNQEENTSRNERTGTAAAGHCTGKRLAKKRIASKTKTTEQRWKVSIAPVSSKSFQRVIGVLSGPEMRHINFTQCRPESPAWLHHQIEIMDFVWKGQGCTQPQRKWGHKGTGSLHTQMCLQSLVCYGLSTIPLSVANTLVNSFS